MSLLQFRSAGRADMRCRKLKRAVNERELAKGAIVTMNSVIEAIEKEYMKKEVPEFSVGDTVKVFVKVVEGNRERLQAFEGIVIARRSGSVRETFVVRRMSFGVGIERVFPLHSPRIDRIEVIRKGKVRRAKLYYLRALSGKAAKIKERM